MHKYISKAKDVTFFSTSDLINGLSNLSKRIVQKNIKESIRNYLQELLTKKILTKIVNNTQRNNLYIKQRYYFK